ncbi:hypothetical protein [Herbidospora mongoliensis]|uniref:hypothetical protein n=1 Tax=Herbidospora mongoliensis TaxID=688067 RepID=UPI00082E68C9|nr:hypothetical protein [Herbidospora mongoliensis]
MNDREQRIGEETVRMFDFMSRMTGAIEIGDWSFAQDKLEQLCEPLERLAVQLFRKDQPASGEPVLTYVQEHAPQYRIGRALYGAPAEQQSPLAQAEDAKRRRDLGGEVAALMAGEQSLKNAPWYPLKPGDIVHIRYDAIDDVMPAFGETYAIEAGSSDGFLNMRLMVRSGDFDPGTDLTVADDPDPLMDAWLEGGPHIITIVRDGVVVHGGNR